MKKDENYILYLLFPNYVIQKNPRNDGVQNIFIMFKLIGHLCMRAEGSLEITLTFPLRLIFCGHPCILYYHNMIWYIT